MFKIYVYIQYILPQHLLTLFMGFVADLRIAWFKNTFIRWFIHHFQVDMSEAIYEKPEDYENFNQFFIRKLKPQIRPIAEGKDDIISPVDGIISQIGNIKENQLLQAKNFYFDLQSLLGGNDDIARLFYDGSFATLYLAPRNYHRVHMPLNGNLIKTIYIPGRLFSVNRITSQIVPTLYARNERFISLFQTDAGNMAVILVGALIVGSIKTVWQKEPQRSNEIIVENVTNKLALEKGAELGYFKIGSTVIVLFEKNKIDWSPSLSATTQVHLGIPLGKVKSFFR